MHGILSFSRFGQKKTGTAPNEKIRSYFDEIQDSGNRLMSLLNDLLDLAKLEAGKVEYSMTVTELSQIARSVCSELEAFAREREVGLEVSGGDVVGKVDSGKIMQALRNLLSNAIKFSHPGTTARILFLRHSGKIRCQVANHGVGIPESELDTIFDKFVQSSKTKTGAGGTGLGLAITKEIIEQHGGIIWAESEKGGETRFVIELPEVV